MTPDGNDRIEIGAALRDARRRYGMDVREVEERTKIRARYIRALENEQWDALPAPAYIRGFIRTYGQLLGLDGEMLVDQYRRRYGDEEAPGGPTPAEPLLSERRRPGERRPSRGPVIAAVLVGIVVLLVLLGLLGGSDGGDGTQPAGKSKQAREAQRKAERQAKRREKKRKQEAANAIKEEDAKLEALSTVQVCLVAGSDSALIDNQVLQLGAQESFGNEKHYRLTIGPGSIKFVVGDNKEKLEVTEPASFEGDSKGIRSIEYRGLGCP